MVGLMFILCTRDVIVLVPEVTEERDAAYETVRDRPREQHQEEEA